MMLSIILMMSMVQVTHPNKSERYLQLCPNQRKSLACNPKNIDQFIKYHLDRGDNITHILSKTYIHGTCYYKSKKYCPTVLESCNSQTNVGYKWSLKGVCQEKHKPCPNISIHEACNNISCPKHSYFCNPQGCIPETAPCHHHCPQLKTQNGIKNNNSLVPCGHKCIPKSAARDMYSCGDSCLEKSEVCRKAGNMSCSQHYSVCGDICVDRFSQALWESHTGRPLYHTCDGQCLNYSSPFLESAVQAIGYVTPEINASSLVSA